MQWVRRISLVKRVVYGFSGLGSMVAALGGAAAWAAQSQAGALGHLLEVAAAGKAPVAVELLTLQANAESAAVIFGVVSAACCAAAALAGWLVVSSIKQSVESTVHCVLRIAGGDLETKIDSSGKDEISWLRAELNAMRKKLRTAVVEVRQTIDGVNIAADEVAAGNLDLSARTESQASALQQTTASMQLLASTVRSNAESTHEAKSVVEISSQVATRGAQVMQDVITRMAEISVSSAKISEIIGVIDGIAFQTNILALNAAVEAARAGEQGRGFAVVASEVRNLAQRSSTAAREIKALIGDSSEKVRAGSNLVDGAGRTMQEIVESVSRVALLIEAIDAAGQSQSSGISEVHDAIAQIDNMTQQNAALVEQLAAAAQSLKGQSGRLTGSVALFRVAG